MGWWGKRYRELRSITGRYKIGGGGVKNSVGNGEAKELCMTHGLRVGMLVGAGCRAEGDIGEKRMGQLKQHNKIYLRKKKILRPKNLKTTPCRNRLSSYLVCLVETKEV